LAFQRKATVGTAGCLPVLEEQQNIKDKDFFKDKECSSSESDEADVTCMIEEHGLAGFAGRRIFTKNAFTQFKGKM
jgi:hypothetical protein